MQTTVVHIHQYYIENYFWLLVSLRSQLCAKQYGGVGMKPKQLKRLKNRHRQQRLSLFLRQACPKSKGANYEY